MIELLVWLALGAALGYIIVVAQMVVLARLFKSQAWILLAAGFTISGLRIVWSFIRLPSRLIRAASNDRIPEHITIEQWVLTLSIFVVLVLMIAGLDRLRQDLRRIGV